MPAHEDSQIRLEKGGRRHSAGKEFFMPNLASLGNSPFEPTGCEGNCQALKL
ncbi:hypothetical protein B4125_1941 [Bacillus paralicheniformis]|uniref:Uncharacterized protein n=1 Tax=Bacillus paralicheniformis TaxID=1648923 RepID=A0A6N2GQ82_9BACI|nr:hypothetical protein SC10_B2orf03589 [Bacillus paralicheniformis]OLF90070.1 hypothetical protein B4121_3345 [Bacillus paralicheniformis]OLG07760.1 hypothetical protein B4125_1941 [Bacillus paralicheniformis]TWJ33320.1 hypothetical protein CHCC5027_3280 [Bacillus paralicheniformis]TWJ60981.1 hypothetical protein CHCC5021_3737 [Bacillus paralicheniformis]